MTSDEELVRNLELIVTELNLATDKINKRLLQWELVLKDISPGLITWFQDKDNKSNKFGYYRFKSGWHLAVKVEDEDPQPILEAARYYRLALLKRMPQIIEALTEAAKGLAEKMNKYSLETIE